MKDMIDEKIFVERLRDLMARSGCENKPTEYAKIVGCSEKTIRNALKGKVPGPEILGKIATADYSPAWLLGGQPSVNATNCRDVITQSVIGQGTNDNAITIEVSERERKIILGLREYFSPAEIRALEQRIDERSKQPLL